MSGASEVAQHSVHLSVKNRVGVLKDILAAFEEQQANLSGIRSLPSKAQADEYDFFIDFQLPTASLQTLATKLQAQATNVTFLDKSADLKNSGFVALQGSVVGA